MLRGKAAVITGSTSGIGLAIAEALASAGCRIVLNGILSREKADDLVQRFTRQYGTDVFYHPADVSHGSECAALIQDTQARYGVVDILINNAGIQHVAPVEKFPVDQWNAILAVNLSSAFHTIQAALPEMQQRKSGRIINIASVHGLVASIHKAAYVAAKHGLVGLTKVVALENAANGITCNAICPGFVLTPLIQTQINNSAGQGVTPEEAGRKLMEGKQPSGRFISGEDIAALVIFLCSPAASGITGASLPIDGAWTAQ